MHRYIGSIKFKKLEKKLEEIFELEKSRFGPLESMAEAILTCPKLFIHKRSLLARNKYVTFDIILACFSYARYLVRNKFPGDTSIAEGDLLGYVYAGSNALYNLTHHDIVNTGVYRIAVFDNIYESTPDLQDALKKIIEETAILLAHDFDSCTPTYYGEDTPLTILPIQAILDYEVKIYLTPMFRSLEKIISNY